MNRKELSIVIALFALLVAWGVLNRKQLAPPPAPVAPAAVADATNALPSEPAALPPVELPVTAALPPVATLEQAPILAAAETFELSNALTRVFISSRGAAVSAAELPGYRATVEKDSGPVHIDFNGGPALALEGLPGLGIDQEFERIADAGGTAVAWRAVSPAGIVFTRILTLQDAYRLEILDTFANPSGEPLELPAHAVTLGPMHAGTGETIMAGLINLGMDTLAAEGGARVTHWGKKLNEMFGVATSHFGCSAPSARNLPMSGMEQTKTPMDWVAVKNKYFVQILAPAEPAQDCRLRVTREPGDGSLVIESVAADLLYPAQSLAPGTEITRRATYYVGPKKYTTLKALGKYQQDIMQFGWWDWFRWLCSVLLWTLNALYTVIPNYGVAVILVTVIVRLLFWPITAKSNQSMKKMQKIQPLVLQIRERHKDNPQKMNQEIMGLYREHRVNPMSGCLPMLVQIPVFIALFTVLRSAIELRFAPFLWIHDLSEPEGLLRDVLPISLNILPLLMTATTVLQQKLTPTTGDPQQQKIMMIMPVMFLFMFYSMASGLVLYWTVSQALAILQLVMQQRSNAREAAAEAIAPPPPAAVRPVSKKRKGKR